jgi:hypothetical protein
MPQQPVVRLVTPAGESDKKHASRDAFKQELDRLLNQQPHIEVDYKVCYGGYTPSGLQTAAGDAVTDAQNAGPPAAIVAAGQKATIALQAITKQRGLTTSPIIQAAGGGPPPDRERYVTGFTLNELAVAQYHLQHVNSQEVTILYDPTNSGVYNELTTNPYGKAITPLPITTPDQLKNPDTTKLKGGVMLIPNAMFYNNCDLVAKYVDGKTVNGKLVAIYYPEIEYKNEHKLDATTVTVYGHDIQGTYRLAAGYVYSILKNQWDVDNPPPFQEATRYP